MSRSLDCLELQKKSKTADLMCVDNEKKKKLHVAARRNFYEGIKKNLSLDVINVNARDKKKKTPLIIAANYGHKKKKELLLENPNINPDLKKKNGGPIHLCLQTDKKKIMKLLLKTQRFNLKKKNEASFTPLHVAAIKKNPEAITALCNEPSEKKNALDQTGQSALCMKKKSCDIEAVQAFLARKKKFDMEQKQMDELTQKKIARRTGNCKIIEMVENYVNNSNK
ncbi:nf kappa B inhibitor I-kappa-B [Tritrichomonas foetus]|uniref:Nf kappa B inhibitor I-kappa-B n=1 Tax=Tritrichomonas foetus TaxID=1144522 RepID=A0A1J4KFF3_9EUKA|nr:nf kappa B inhibitor I-kappa-B [Tritrichomonas foetus]|eukprot:OHT10185.1 nf kappa B inhibitor I-kappa-B [Tritrichomonas foetus]